MYSCERLLVRDRLFLKHAMSVDSRRWDLKEEIFAGALFVYALRMDCIEEEGQSSLPDPSCSYRFGPFQQQQQQKKKRNVAFERR